MNDLKSLCVLQLDSHEKKPEALMKEVFATGLFDDLLVLGSLTREDQATPFRLQNDTNHPVIIQEHSASPMESREFADVTAWLKWLSDQSYKKILRVRPNGFPLEPRLIADFWTKYIASHMPYGCIASWNAFLQSLLIDAWDSDALKRRLSRRDSLLYTDGRLNFENQTFEYELDLQERRFFYLDHFERLFGVPHTLQIELSSRCNSRCPKCIFHGKNSPHYDPKTDSPPFMDENLFRKIIDEFSTFRTRTGLAVALNYRGESQMHPSFYELAEYARQKSVRTVINTNAKLLTPEATRKILDLDLTGICFSIDSLNPETFRKLQTADLQQVLSNIDFLVQEKAKRGSGNPILSTIHVISSETASELYSIVDFFLPIMDLVTFSMYQDIRKRTISAPHTFFDIERRYPCNHLWEVMTVLSSGKVIRCGYDFNHEDTLGDLRNDSIREVWNSEKMRSYRQEMCVGNFGNVPICDHCPRWKANLRKMELVDGLLVTTQWEGKTFQKIRKTFDKRTLEHLCAEIPPTVSAIPKK